MGLRRGRYKGTVDSEPRWAIAVRPGISPAPLGPGCPLPSLLLALALPLASAQMSSPHDADPKTTFELDHLRETSPFAMVVTFVAKREDRVYIGPVGPPASPLVVQAWEVAVEEQVWGAVGSDTLLVFRWEELPSPFGHATAGDRFLLFAHPWELNSLNGIPEDGVLEPHIYAADGVGTLSSHTTYRITSGNTLASTSDSQVCISGDTIGPCSGTGDALEEVLGALRKRTGPSWTVPGLRPAPPRENALRIDGRVFAASDWYALPTLSDQFARLKAFQPFGPPRQGHADTDTYNASRAAAARVQRAIAQVRQTSLHDDVGYDPEQANLIQRRLSIARWREGSPAELRFAIEGARALCRTAATGAAKAEAKECLAGLDELEGLLKRME